MRFSKLHQISGLWVEAFTRSAFVTQFPLNSDEAGSLTPFRTFKNPSFCLQWHNKRGRGERERNSSKNRLRTRVERNDKECWEAKIHIRKEGFECSQRPKGSIKASILTARMLKVIKSQPVTLIFSLITLQARLWRETFHLEWKTHINWWLGPKLILLTGQMLIPISHINLHTSDSRCCVFLCLLHLYSVIKSLSVLSSVPPPPFFFNFHLR